LRAEIHVSRDKFAAMNAVPGRAHDLGHVCPHPIPALPAEWATEASAFDGHPPCLGLVANRFHILRRQVGISKMLTFRVRVDLYKFRILSRAAQEPTQRWSRGAKPPTGPEKTPYTQGRFTTIFLFPR